MRRTYLFDWWYYLLRRYLELHWGGWDAESCVLGVVLAIYLLEAGVDPLCSLEITQHVHLYCLEFLTFGHVCKFILSSCLSCDQMFAETSSCLSSCLHQLDKLEIGSIICVKCFRCYASCFNHLSPSLHGMQVKTDPSKLFFFLHKN